MAISEVPKIESNVIQLMPSNVREPLEAFTRTLRLSDFLEALKAIAPLKVPIDPLIKTWEAHLYKFAENLPKRGTLIYTREEREKFEIDIAPFTTIVGWLAQFELDSKLRKNETESDENDDTPTENTPDETDDPEEIDGLEVPHMSNSELNAIADSAIQIDIESDKLWRNAKDKYPCFPTAWPLESELPKHFGDDDPAASIAQFLATFYQVRERGTGCHIGDNRDDGLKFKLITIRNPGWLEFVEGSLIDNLIALETMHWMNDANITEVCKINPELINSGEAVIKDLVHIAENLNGRGTVDASVKAGQLLMHMHGIRIDAWMKDVIETRKAQEIRGEAEEDELDETEDDGVSTEYDDEEAVESKRKLARIQGLCDVLPLVKGIVFCGAKHGDYPGPFSDEFEFSESPRLLPLLPQAMFERVVYWASEYRDDSFDNIDQFFYSGNAAFLDVMLSWPMDEEAFFWGDFDHPVLRGKLWGEKIHDIASFDKVPHMNIPLLERIFQNWFSAWGADNIITAARQAKENVLSPTGYSIQRLSYLIEHSIERISHARRITYAGLSPFSMDSAAQLGSDLSKLCPLIKLTPKHDLSYLIAAHSDWDDDGFGRSPFAARVYKQDTPEETQRYAQDRAANYMRVFHAAVEEGWDEFANAALAFFLFSQPIHFERRFWVDWRDLGAALRLAPTLKGYHRVKRALEVAGAMICGDGQRHYDALCLAAWVPADAPPVELPADFTGVTVSRRTMIEQELVRYLGSETWIKLGSVTKQLLVEADLQWEESYRGLGRDRKNWGTNALAYVKPIEGELKRKLAKVISSAAFIDHYTSTKKKPYKDHDFTLGPMLHFIKEFESLDQTLQHLIIDSNIRLQDDGALIGCLLDAMEDRNKGGHAGEFSAKRFLILREMLFEKGVLKRFIDLL